MKLLALDFDGVVSDSAPEAFVVALRAYLSLWPKSRLRSYSDPFLVDVAPTLEAIQSVALYSEFLARMPLGNRAEDFAVVLASIDQEIALPDQAAYDAFRTRLDESVLQTFHRRFYFDRDALAARDPEGWYALMAPYAPLLRALRSRSCEVTLAIATAKDRSAVERLLERYGIADLFSASQLLDKEVGAHKTAHMHRLKEHFGVAFGEITFVDDKVNHLDRVAPLGVRCGLAAWGYNGTREIEQAHDRGYAVLELDNLERTLFA